MLQPATPHALQPGADGERAFGGAPQHVDALNRRAHALRHSDARAALVLCRQARALALQQDYQHGLAYGLLRSSICLGILGDDSEDADALLQQAASLMHCLGDVLGEAEALNQQGIRHEMRDDSEAALASYRRALALRESVGDRAGQSAALNNIAIVLRDSGRLADALEHLYRGLHLAEAGGSAESCAYALCNLGVVLARVGEPAAAQLHLERALVCVRQTANRALESTALVELAQLLHEGGESERALPLLQTALGLAQGSGNLDDQALASLALGAVQQALGDRLAAVASLGQAAALAQQRGSGSTAARVLLAQATLGTPGCQVSALLHQALVHAEAVGDEALCATVHERLAQDHEAQGELAAALRHLRQAQACGRRAQDAPSQSRIRAILNHQALARAERDAEDQRLRSAELARELAEVRQAERDRAELLAELQGQAELLQQLAREDGLTGVCNRRWLDLQWQRELERARRFHHPLTVAMIDVDHFKAVNDGLSHAVGDAVLRTLAQLLRNGCRTSDVVGRYGGEEFMLVLVETAPAQAFEVCEKLRQRIEAHDWRAVHPGLGRLSVSIGLAGFEAEAVAADLVEQADRRLYAAKRKGRNRVER